MNAGPLNNSLFLVYQKRRAVNFVLYCCCCCCPASCRAAVLQAPLATRQPKVLETHGDLRTDEYYWWVG